MVTSPSTAAAKTLSMKLLIDTKTQRVLFAAAGKDVVDFLFSLLALPMVTTAKLMTIGQVSVPGSVGNLYSSLVLLDGAYVQAGAGAAKDALLFPTFASLAVITTSCSVLRLPAAPSPSARTQTFYRWRYNRTNFYDYVHRSDESSAGEIGTTCPSCTKEMTTPVYYTGQTNQVQSAAATAGSGGAKGFVQGVVTYTVADDLAVTPMSTISSITLLNTFGVRDLSDLQEKTVQIFPNRFIAGS